MLRERAEEGEETSVAKLAKLEGRSSPVPKGAEPTASSVWNSEAEQHQQEDNILDSNPNFALEDRGIKLTRESGKLARDKTDTETASSEKHAPRKRKELDDIAEDKETLEIVFGSAELDWDDQTTDHEQESQGNAHKKRCLEAKGSKIQKVNIKQREKDKILVSCILLTCLILKFMVVSGGCG